MALCGVVPEGELRPERPALEQAAGADGVLRQKQNELVRTHHI